MRHGHYSNRTGHIFGAQSCAFQRINRNINLGASARANLFTNEQHGGFIALALANHNRAINGQTIEFSAHRINSRLISRLFIPTSAQTGCRHSRTLSHTHQFKGENAFNDILALNDEVAHNWSLVRSDPHHAEWVLMSGERLFTLNADHLRLFGDIAVLHNRFDGFANDRLGCGISNQHDRNWVTRAIGCLGAIA